MSGEGDVANGGRISVSRDALRAELAEFKLQLLTELRSELDRKASKQALDAIEIRVKVLENRDVGEVAVSLHNQDTFTRREKLIGLITAATLVVLGIFQVLHG